jgi:hypothetical protein
MHAVLITLRRATLAASLATFFHAGDALAKPEFGPMIDAFCSASGGEPAQPWDGQCTFCHQPGTFDKTHPVQPNWDEFVAGMQATPDDFSFFCPVVSQMNDPPVLAAIGDQTVNVGEALTLQVSATDPNGDALAFDAADLPTGATFVDHGDGTAEFGWTPTAAQAGNHPVTFLVRDDWSPPASDSETLTISVSSANRPPVLDPIGDQAVGEGEPLSLAIHATDPDGDPLVLAGANLPMGAAFLDHGDGSAEFSWTPAAGQTGSYAVTFSATDDAAPAASDSEQITISVGGANRPPVLDPIGSRTLGDGESLAVTLGASDPDGDALSFAAQGLPAGASLADHADGSAELSWTPDPGASGTFPVTVVVTDAGDPPASDSETFGITVGGANRPPVLAPIGDRSVREGETLALTLTASDPDGDALQLALDGLPAGASFTDHGDGTAELVWTPDAGAAGVHPLVARVTDAGSPSASDSEEFVVTVSADGTPLGLYLEKAAWDARSRQLQVRGGGAPAGAWVEVVDADSGVALRARRAGETGRFRAGGRTFAAPCAVQARVGELVSEPVAVTGAPADCGVGSEPFTRVKKAGWKAHDDDGEEDEIEDDGEDREERDGRRSHEGAVLRVEGERAPAGGEVRIHDADRGALLGSTDADHAGRFRYRAEAPTPPCRVQAGVMVYGEERLLAPVVVRGATGRCGR